jgi:hypothetical protein
MIRSGALAAFSLNGRVRIPPESYLVAERQTLAVKPKVRKKKERIDPRVEALLR